MAMFAYTLQEVNKVNTQYGSYVDLCVRSCHYPNHLTGERL
jgi:hypothetical protein